MNSKRNVGIAFIGVSVTLFLILQIPLFSQSRVLTAHWSGVIKDQNETKDELMRQLVELRIRLKEKNEEEEEVKKEAKSCCSLNITHPKERLFPDPPLSCSIINQTNTTSQASCGGDSYLCHKTPHKCTDFEVRKKGNCSSVESYEKLNKMRKEHLEKICLSKSQYNNRNLYLAYNLREMFYFDKVQYGWCPSYKSASSNVISYMCPLYYGDAICKDKQKNGAVIWRKPQFTVQPKNLKNFVRFVVARDPFNRILSSFRDKLEPYRGVAYVDIMYNSMIVPYRPLQQHLSPRKHELKEIARKKSQEKHRTPTKKGPNINPNNPYENPLQSTFPEFISAVIGGLNEPHWTSVKNYCAPCKMKYDYIIKVEDFTCEFNNFVTATGHPELSTDNTEHWATNKGPSKSDHALYEYFSQLSYEQLDQFYNTYLEDCLLFDFNCEETLCKIKSWKALHNKN